MPTQSSQPNSNNDRHAYSDGSGRKCKDCQDSRQCKYTRARDGLPDDDAAAIEAAALDGVEAMMLADRILAARLFRTYAGRTLGAARFFDVFECFTKN